MSVSPWLVNRASTSKKVLVVVLVEDELQRRARSRRGSAPATLFVGSTFRGAG